MTYLFVDTNILLHYRRMEELDWLALSKSAEVVIVLCPVVVRELDRQKVSHPQKKFRTRAQEITASLHLTLSGEKSSEIRSGVRVEFLTGDPTIDFSTEKLRPELADDWLIASVLEWKRNHPSDQTIIVSSDLGICIKASSKGISTCAPPEADRLTEELDANEKRIKRLEQELAEAKACVPILKICFEDGENVARVKILSPTEFDTALAESELQQIRSKFPLRSIPDNPDKSVKIIHTVGELQKLIRKGGKVERTWPREEILRYNAELEAFYRDYEQYLRVCHDRDNVKSRTIYFEISLENIGGSPAEDVDIHFHFPDGFQLFDAKENEEESVEPPDAPAEPGTFRLDRKTREAMRNVGMFGMGPGLIGPPPNVSPPSIERTNSYDVRSHVERVKHGYRIQVARFRAVFDSFESAGSFRIDYSILAANVPKAIAGYLSVVVEK